MERVVVENNNLGAVLRAGEKALEVCAKNARCRSGLNELGLLKGLTNEQVEEAMKAGITQDPAVIATLTAAQIAYLDAQIKSGTGMAGLMLGSHTWGDRLNLPSNTGGNQIVSPGPTDTGGNQQLDPNGRPTHTGNDKPSGQGVTNTGNIDGKPNTGGNSTVTPIPEHNKDDLAYLDKIKQGEHASIRNKEGRPVGSVINDVQKARPADILMQDDGRWVVLGDNGRVHLLEKNGEVVTSFKNPNNNTKQRVSNGQWQRLNNDQLIEFKYKFSEYVRW